MTDILKTACDVLENEISGLTAVKNTLSGSAGTTFTAIVKTLGDVKGRIIVSGMGKSGHVARKIAATFSSTGAPAHYVHPAEASHGDLGMITRHDLILALSKSGETVELGDLLGYAKRFSIPVIAITAGVNSSLAQAAIATIMLPDMHEACDITYAPTTSTTMMMAIGDALAVSLLRHKGVTADDFQDFHPGGMLGAALRRVRDLMHIPSTRTPLPLCKDDATTGEAVSILSDGGFGCVGIINADGHLIGLLTDGDVRRQFGKDVLSLPVREVMTPNPKTVEPQALAGKALALMNSDKITSLFVVEAGKPVGLVHIHDCVASGVI